MDDLAKQLRSFRPDDGSKEWMDELKVLLTQAADRIEGLEKADFRQIFTQPPL